MKNAKSVDLRFAIGDRVETAHGKHSALERGTVIELPRGILDSNPGVAEWYRVKMDCGCCTYSFDWRFDGWGRIRAAQ